MELIERQYQDRHQCAVGALDSCIAGMFTSGNVGSSSGEPPISTQLVSSYEFDFSKSYNSQYLGMGIA